MRLILILSVIAFAVPANASRLADPTPRLFRFAFAPLLPAGTMDPPTAAAAPMHNPTFIKPHTPPWSPTIKPTRPK